MTRENKIDLIKKLSAGDKNLTASEGRTEMIFQRIGLNQYQQEGKEQLYTLDQIEAMNTPFNLINGETATWKESKLYEDRKEVSIGLPVVVQINIIKADANEPIQVTLPAIDKANL
jgi:hypothetical protein